MKFIIIVFTCIAALSSCSSKTHIDAEVTCINGGSGTECK